LGLKANSYSFIGEDSEKAHNTIQKFKKFDEELLLQQFRFKDNEKQLIHHAKEATAQLEELLKKDAEK